MDLNLIGIDEVGYGSWAGPLYICALKFNQKPNFQLFDSKKINQNKREKLYNDILKISHFQIGVASAEEINEHGLAKAYKFALNRAINNISGDMLIDGSSNRGINAKCVIKGDGKVPVISAASIIAKVQRDALMLNLHIQYPLYHFDKNKGYGTSQHKLAIIEHGFCNEHRINYNFNF